MRAPPTVPGVSVMFLPVIVTLVVALSCWRPAPIAAPAFSPAPPFKMTSPVVPLNVTVTLCPEPTPPKPMKALEFSVVPPVSVVSPATFSVNVRPFAPLPPMVA